VSRASLKLSSVGLVPDKRACIESSGQFSGDTAKRKSIVVIHCWSLNIGNFLSRRRLVVSLSVSHAGNWGKILIILFRHTLH
jgi:hypothetical protein